MLSVDKTKIVIDHPEGGGQSDYFHRPSGAFVQQVFPLCGQWAKHAATWLKFIRHAP